MVFDPDYQEIDCPKCLQKRIYFDCEIGFYCMSCGYEISDEEALFLIEKVTSASKSAPDSGRTARLPIVEVKKKRGRSSQPDHISPGTDETQTKKTE